MPNNPAQRRAGAATPTPAANEIVRRAGLPASSTPTENSTPATVAQPSTLTETSGPTVLTVASITDGQVLIRSGATITGVTGLSVTVPLAKLTGAGVNGSITFTNGVLTARVDPT